MKPFFKAIGIAVGIVLAAFAAVSLVQAATVIFVPQGGTGSTTLTGILKGNGTAAVQTAIPGTDYVANVTGNWTGTFDGQEGTYYLSRVNHTGTQAASSITGGTFGSGNYIFPSNATTTLNHEFGSIRLGADHITDFTGTGLTVSAGALTLVTSGDWTGTFDGQEGTYYLSRANHTGTQAASTITGGTFGSGDFTFPFHLIVTGNSTTTQASTTHLSVSGTSRLGTVTSGVWNGTVIGDAYLTKSGDWTGTFDGQEGTYYLARANHTGTQAASTITSGTFGSGDYTFPAHLIITGNSTTTQATTTHLNVSGTSRLGTVLAGTWNGTSISDTYVDDNITLTNITQITNRAISDTTGTLTAARGGTGTTSPSQFWYGPNNGTLVSTTTISQNHLDPLVILSSEIDTYSELNTLVGDVTLTHNGLIDTYSELNAIVADVTLTHNGLIDTFSELDAIVADQSLAHTGSAMTGTFDGNNFAGGAIAAGELLYGASAGSITELTLGASSTILTTNGTIPAWSAHPELVTLRITGTGTSTLIGGTLGVNLFNATSTTASSTIAGGLEITGGNLRVSALISCDTIDTDSLGYLTCGADATGGAGSEPGLVYGTTYGAGRGTASTTGLGFWFQGASYASSSLLIDGNFSIGSTTLVNALNVQGESLFSGGLRFASSTATGTVTATGLAAVSTFNLGSEQITGLAGDSTLSIVAGNLRAVDLVCTDCLNATEIEDIYLLIAGDSSSGNFTWTGAHDFGGGTLESPNSASCVTDATGEHCIDTTTRQFQFYDGNATQALSATTSRAMQIASTTLNAVSFGGTGTSFSTSTFTRVFSEATTLVSFHCFSRHRSSSAQNAIIWFGDGSASTSVGYCNQSGQRIIPSSNNTFTADEIFMVAVGSATGTIPDSVSIEYSVKHTVQ